MTGFLKAIAAVVVAGISYVDNTYTPLIWVLAALVALDLILNMHQEEKQFSKVGSAAAALGIPSIISSHYGMPHFTQTVVVLLTIAYIQVTFPQVAAMIPKIRFSKDAKKNAQDVAEAEAVEALVQSKIEAYIQSVAGSLSVSVPSPAPVAPPVTIGGTPAVAIDSGTIPAPPATPAPAVAVPAGDVISAPRPAPVVDGTSAQ